MVEGRTICEEPGREHQRTDNDEQDGEYRDENAGAAAEIVGGDEHGKIVEIKDDGRILDEVGPEERPGKKRGRKGLLEVLKKQLLQLPHEAASLHCLHIEGGVVRHRFHVKMLSDRGRET